MSDAGDESFPSRFDRVRADTRSTEELIKAALEVDFDDARRLGYPVSVLHARGTREVLDAALILCDAESPAKRELGALILGQLGLPDRSFPEECCDRLVQFLQQEQDLDVLTMAVFALGHLVNRRADPYVAKLKSHPNAHLRHGVAFALVGTTHPNGVQALLELMRDSNELARDWATTSIRETTVLDGPEIRDALLERCSDPDTGTRAEAHQGLARRRDVRLLPYLIAELEKQSKPTIEDRDENYDYGFRDAAKIYLDIPEEDEIDAHHLLSALRRLIPSGS